MVAGNDPNSSKVALSVKDRLQRQVSEARTRSILFIHPWIFIDFFTGRNDQEEPLRARPAEAVCSQRRPRAYPRSSFVISSVSICAKSFLRMPHGGDCAPVDAQRVERVEEDSGAPSVLFPSNSPRSLIQRLSACFFIHFSCALLAVGVPRVSVGQEGQRGEGQAWHALPPS